MKTKAIKVLSSIRQDDYIITRQPLLSEVKIGK